MQRRKREKFCVRKKSKGGPPTSGPDEQKRHRRRAAHNIVGAHRSIKVPLHLAQSKGKSAATEKGGERSDCLS